MAEDGIAVGTVGWRDLTVPDALELRTFYEDVVGWTTEAVDMGGYSDYVMKAPGSGEAVAGICHARGPHADLPPQWLAYIAVADLDQSLTACDERGGTVIVAARGLMGGRMAVIRDPAGAVCALWQPPPASPSEGG